MIRVVTLRRCALVVSAPLALIACASALGFDDIVPPAADAAVDAPLASDGTAAGADAGVDAPVSGPTCNLNTTFAATTPLTVGSDAGLAEDGHPTLTPDELTLYFQRLDPSSRVHIYRASRSSRDMPFGDPAPVAAIEQWLTIQPNGPTDVAAPSVSSDGSRLYFVARVAATTAQSVLAAARTNGAPDFTEVFVVAAPGPAPATPFVTAKDDHLLISNDNQVLRLDFYGPLEAYNGLVLADSGTSPVMSANESLLLFSDVPGGRIFAANVSPDGSAGQPAPLPRAGALNDSDSGASEPGWLSPDNCRLYFQHGNGIMSQLFVATRSP